jgi:hypothetical protein
VWDLDAFAGELHPLHPPARPRAATVRARAAISAGMFAGLVPATCTLAFYFVAHSDLPLPWATIAALLAIYAPFACVSLSLMVDATTVLLDRIARAWAPLAIVANPVVAGAIAGVICGIIPGAIGVRVFGAYHGPFVGTAPIAIALVAASAMVAVPAARRARRARGRDPRDDARAIAIAALVATLILGAIAVILTPIIVQEAFAHAGAFAENGVLVGSIVGAVAGGVIGVYVGMVIALARR